MKITIELSFGNEKIIIESSSTEDIMKELENVKKIVKSLSTFNLKPVQVSEPKKEETKKESVSEYSPIELLKSSNASSLSDKLILLFYYLWKSKGMLSINSVDIKNIFNESMEALPANPTALLKYLQKKGYLKPETKKDKLYAWSITKTGSDYVEEKLLKKGPAEDGKP